MIDLNKLEDKKHKDTEIFVLHNLAMKVSLYLERNGSRFVFGTDEYRECWGAKVALLCMLSRDLDHKARCQCRDLIFDKMLPNMVAGIKKFSEEEDMKWTKEICKGLIKLGFNDFPLYDWYVSQLVAEA